MLQFVNVYSTDFSMEIQENDQSVERMINLFSIRNERRKKC